MYPFFRMALALRRARRIEPVPVFGTHVSHHWVTPLDIDIWLELNNGRTLTLYDLARVPMFLNMGFAEKAKGAGIYFAVAGASVRYRQRVTPFQKVEIRTRVLGWDDRFYYTEQSMWRDGTCVNHLLLRSATARRGKGIVPPSELAGLMGMDHESPPLPDWVQAWIAADSQRPWPPEMHAPQA